MINIESIVIENFRGIKRLQHNLNNTNLVIYGPNGSGKSGVIDAIEFALTGNICRLSGTGTSSINISNHAPHVDFRDVPNKSKVTIKIINKQTQNSFTIKRTVANYKKPEILPNNKEAQNILDFLAHHPEFSLSRREILKFIITEPGKRAKEVQELLKLESIDKIRTNLTKFRNETIRTFQAKSDALNKNEARLIRHFEIPEISKKSILDKANASRKILGLEPIINFNTDTKFAIDLDRNIQNDKRSINKKLANSRISQLLKKLNLTATASNQKNVSETEQSSENNNAIKSIEEIKNDPCLLQHINKQRFYNDGLKFIIDDLCPFCDSSYNSESLITYIKEKIERNKQATILKNNVISACNKVKTDYDDLIEEFNEVKRDARALQLTDEIEKLIAISEKLKLDCKLLMQPFDNIEETYNLIQSPYNNFKTQVVTILQNILSCINEIVDVSSEEKAKQFLFVADERLDNYKSSKQEKDIWEKRKKLTEKISAIFEECSENKLTELYKSIETEFSYYYEEINDDEKDFNVELTHSNGKLNLGVDFYNRGIFPPNAFHSEGHQDGMGLCLYLALSKKILRDNFTFCLLDDVLMSVDTNHRRELCRLLKSKFSNTQFIITTHDEVWKRQLNSERVVKSKQILSFNGWSVDSGPSCLDEKDILDTLDDSISNGNIKVAAPTLRQYLEYIMTELSIKLRAKLEPRYDHSYDLGELSSAVISKYKECLKKAKKAAESWQRKEEVDRITRIDKELSLAIEEKQMEQWILNPSIHYNTWANFSTPEFLSLKNTFFQFLEKFKCDQCNNWLYALPQRGNLEEIKCDCGEFRMNMKENHIK